MTRKKDLASSLLSKTVSTITSSFRIRICVLTTVYLRRVDVINRGYGGYNTDHALKILPRVLEAELDATQSNVPLLTIFFGTNDAVNTTQHVPIERYTENIEKLILMAHEKKIRPVIIGPGLHDRNLANAMFFNRGDIHKKDITTNRNNKCYSEAAEKIARKHNVPFVDMWRAFCNELGLKDEQVNEPNCPDLKELVYDGIHFTPRAYKLLYDGVVAAIDNLYPEISSKNLTLKLPHWTEIDPKNIEKTLFRQ